MLYFILFDSNLTAKDAVIYFLITVLVYMISITVHEFAHAFTAYKCGDSTAKLAGRMTLNPFKHLDGFGLFLFIFVGIGWAKPVPINPLNFKKYKTGTRIVSIAGVVSNLLLGLISAITVAVLLATVGQGGVALGYLYSVLNYFMIVNSFLFMFNILPIAPLDGFNFISTFTKADNKFINFMAKNGFKVLIGIILFGMLTDLFFGFDAFSEYLALLYNHVFRYICYLGV